MPSDGRARSAWSLLRSQGLGLLCAQATVALLAIGSVVLARTREGESRGVQLDELGGFFETPSWTHAWLYALFPVLGLYALNTVLCTWHAVAQRLRARIWAAAAWGPTFLHVGFLLALLAHLAGGFLAREGEQVRLDRRWRPLPEGREARLLDMRVERHPDGRPRTVRASVALRTPGQAVREEVLGFNEPLTRGLGAELILLEQYGEVPAGARVRVGGERCELWLGSGCEVAGLVVRLGDVVPGGRWHGEAMAELQAVRPAGALERGYVALGREMRLSGGEGVVFEEVLSSPAVVARTRRNPGHPWLLAAALLSAVGLVLMGRRWR